MVMKSTTCVITERAAILSIYSVYLLLLIKLNITALAMLTDNKQLRNIGCLTLRLPVLP